MYWRFFILLLHKKQTRWIGASFLGALTLTTSLYFLDIHFATHHLEETQLQLSRQVASQAGGLFFSAKSLNEKDPLEWALHHLNQGNDPKTVWITKIKTKADQPKETFQWLQDENLFEYEQKLSPAEGSGIQIKIKTPKIGFLGSRSRLANDLLALSLFVVFFGIFLVFSYYFYFYKNRAATIKPAVTKEQLIPWLEEAKKLLAQFGIHLREIIRGTQSLVQTAAESRDKLAHLQGRVQGGIQEMEEAKQNIKESEAVLVGAEAMVLNLLLEAARMGEEGHRFSDLAEELHQLIQKIRKLHQNSASSIHHVEGQIQPWGKEMEEALRLYDGIWNTTQQINEHIHQSSQALGNQSKHLKTFDSGENIL